jgi:hypothetical protein
MKVTVKYLFVLGLMLLAIPTAYAKEGAGQYCYEAENC